MLKVKYCEDNAYCVPDKKVDKFVKDIIDRYNTFDCDFIAVSSELIISRFRLAIKEGDIKSDDIVFITEYDIEIIPNSNGSLPVWPAGFCDTNDNLLDKLIDFQINA